MVIPESSPTAPDLTEDDKSSVFGPWMLVTHRKKTKQANWSARGAWDER